MGRPVSRAAIIHWTKRVLSTVSSVALGDDAFVWPAERSVAGIGGRKDREGARMTISALAKVVGILTVLVILIGLLVYTQKAATPVPQQTAIQSAPTITATQPGPDPWSAALSAVKECKVRRLGGELKTFVQSAMCSNPGIVQAFSAVNFKHMDLIQAFTAKRLELAEKLDLGQITEAQSERELSDFSNRIRKEEAQ
jgi:hypothetical protein